MTKISSLQGVPKRSRAISPQTVLRYRTNNADTSLTRYHQTTMDKNGVH